LIGLYFFAFAGTGTIGGILSGWLTAAGGTELAFAVAGIAGVSMSAFVWFRSRAIPVVEEKPLDEIELAAYPRPLNRTPEEAARRRSPPEARAPSLRTAPQGRPTRGPRAGAGVLRSMGVRKGMPVDLRRLVSGHGNGDLFARGVV